MATKLALSQHCALKNSGSAAPWGVLGKAEEVACPLHVALVTYPERCAPQDRRHGLAGATPAKVTKEQKLEELLSLAGRGSTRI